MCSRLTYSRVLRWPVVLGQKHLKADRALGTLIQKLSSPRKIVITTHVKPDADALGSSLGLSNYLIKKGHEVTVISPSDYPYFLTWMKGNDQVLDFSIDRSSS